MTHFQYLKKMYRPVAFLCLIVLVLTLLMSGLNVLFAGSLQNIINFASQRNGNLFDLLVFVAITVSICLSVAIIRGAVKFINKKIALKVEKNVRVDLLNHAESMTFSLVKELHTEDFITRATMDTEQVTSLFTEVILPLISGISSCLFSLIFAFSISKKLTFVIIMISPLLIVLGKLFVPNIEKYTKNERESEEKIRSYMQEQYVQIPYIKASLSHSFSISKLLELWKEKYVQGLKWSKWFATFGISAEMVATSVSITCMGYGAYLCFQGEIEVGAIIAFVQLLNYILGPFAQIPDQFAQLKMRKVSIERILKIIHTPTEEKSNLLMETVSDIKKLQIKDVCFSFGKKSIFQNINATFKKNEITAIVGASGAGKSTLIQLILGLYSPEDGEIVIETPTQHLCIGMDTRIYFSYVPQDHILFSGTIAENIRYGNIDASMDQVINAAMQAGAKEFIKQLPKGFDTQITENGRNLSFGQAQRIAIARALLKNAPILLLDEPTASVDVESERLILESLGKVKKDKIIIMVTHNKSSLDYCDNVVCI